MASEVLRKMYGRLFLLAIAGFIAGIGLVLTGMMLRPRLQEYARITDLVLLLARWIALVSFPFLFVTGFWYVKARRGTLNYRDIDE